MHSRVGLDASIPCVHNVDTKDLAAIELLAMGRNPEESQGASPQCQGPLTIWGFHQAPQSNCRRPHQIAPKGDRRPNTSVE